MVERTMSGYINNLKELVCKTGGQVDTFVKNVLRKEDIDNGNRPNGQTHGTGRFGALQNTVPTHQAKYIDDGTSSLLPDDDSKEFNNNPNYHPNMIELLNTPFDHIERIVLQDFSDVLISENENYFKGLFSFPGDASGTFHGGFSGFKMIDRDGIATEGNTDLFDPINSIFNWDLNQDKGGFFIDSFTYTPFVDYSQVDEGGDSRIGIYSDQFLTDYNTEKYDNNPDSNQVDKYRHKLSSKLYELGNLKKDIEDAKVSFRNAVANQDNKTYIYTFCEHLATLFAKLSDIRMSYEIYGFKHPHQQWEGILALDIWYNLLYREIDAKYPFDDKYLDMNPMQRRKVNVQLGSISGKYVLMDDGRKLTLRDDGQVSWDSDPTVVDGLEWMPDETSEEFVYIWDSNLWADYYDNSKAISERRKECTTPRGVLAKVYRIVRELEYKWEYYLNQKDSDQDYKWFEQKGKVYTHWKNDKSMFTKYVNLHLGRAYDVMGGKEYFELTGKGYSDGMYIKPKFSDITDESERRELLDNMLERGFQTLIDAFSVVKNERLFNVYCVEQSTGQIVCDSSADVIHDEGESKILCNTSNLAEGIEELELDNLSCYPQSQCAIALERVFSRIYKYLQFKSTTSETFQRHINIDSGYKYLTAESLKASNHNLNVYYDFANDGKDGVQKHYLRYLSKINECLNDTDFTSTPVKNPYGLTKEEYEVLGDFHDVLSKQTLEWLEEKWDLCPLLNRASEGLDELSPRKAMLRSLKRDIATEDDSSALESSPESKELYLDFSKYEFMDSWQAEGNINVPDDWNIAWESPNMLRIKLEDEMDGIDLSKLTLEGTKPTYTLNYLDEDEHPQEIVVPYDIAGYTSTSKSSIVRFTKNQIVSSMEFGDLSRIKVCVAWDPEDYILKFSSDNSHYKSESAGHMLPVMLSDVNEKAPRCTFNPPGETRKQFKYYNSQDENKSWQDTTEYNEDSDNPDVALYGFKNWSCALGGLRYTLRENEPLSVNVFNLDSPPVIQMTAYWERAYDVISFTIDGELYCEVCIDVNVNKVVYPNHPPVIQPEGGTWEFYGWNYSQGDYLPGVDRSAIIICGEREKPVVCRNNSASAAKIICDDQDPNIVCTPPDGTPTEYDIVCRNDKEYIVCKEDDVDYTVPIEAYLVEHKIQKFKVTFLYMNESGASDSHSCEVPQNHHLPRFHIHNSYVDGDRTFTFRHWLLQSGNLTSSLTVLSDLVFVAVYDETVDAGETSQPDVEPEGLGNSIDPMQQGENVPNVIDCVNYLKTYSESGHTHEHYCSLTGLDPRKYEDHFEELDDCPYVKILRELYGYDNLTPKSVLEKEEFKQTTLIEIRDIANLLKALFKINLDIAHREYFLKIDIPEESNWWYGYTTGEVNPYIVCDPTSGDICCYDSSDDDDIMCIEQGNWISFEPMVELKFSNLHSDNQIDEEGNLICTTSDDTERYPNKLNITPVNRELSFSSVNNESVHFNDLFYCYDYWKSWKGTHKRAIEPQDDKPLEKITISIGDSQEFYKVKPLCLYENTQLQSPTDVNDFIRHRLSPIDRSTTITEEENGTSVTKLAYRKVRTFTSMVKKYRPVIMPNVRDIFNDCHTASNTKYEADIDNNYGVFGWCTIPSKTMVNMEYNEASLYVPSSYDHHNRVCGSNFLQMDNDFKYVYRKQVQNILEDNAQETWAWLYNTRDWTYFAKPFFDVGRNNEVYSSQLDAFNIENRPKNSNHINGVVFEKSAERRSQDMSFLGIASSCQFLARYHHSESNLKVLSERYTNLIPYSTLKNLTNNGNFNDVYGSEYVDIPDDFRFPFTDWIDDYDKTSSYVGLKNGDYESTNIDSSEVKYKYNLGHAHSIDDFDEDSVWFYITMVSPLDELDSVIELEDIMPYVFWWENRGTENNGPDVDCYGKVSSSKLNYEQGGWCYSMAHERQDEDVWMDMSEETPVEKRKPKLNTEHSWHAVSNTLGVDFSKKDNGGTLLTTDNSGNVYKGAFDPNCAGTDEKWKIHHLSNAFGANQHEDPIADKYYLGENAHGDYQFSSNVTPSTLNEDILNSIKDRPMTWNLWNVVRHYVYIKYFKNRHKTVGSDASAWAEMEKYTKKLVKGIYRTFKDNRRRETDEGQVRNTFSDIDETSTNYGGQCQVHWTNSFIEVSTILERNARDHMASFVLFTGNAPKPTDDQITEAMNAIQNEYGKYDPELVVSRELASARVSYDVISKSHDSFRVVTNEGVDADDSEDGMRKRVLPENAKDPYSYAYIAEDESARAYNPRIFQGFKYGDLPTTYVIGNGTAYSQRQQDTSIDFTDIVDFDKMYPESEYYLNDKLRKWVRKIRRTVLNKQILPVYTSMENMDKDIHSITVEELKSITFQVVPSFYWKYEWSYNEFMIHRVGKLKSPSKELEMYDMLGNVWEWVRDDWSPTISVLDGKVNPIVGTKEHGGNSDKKVIKGGSFDQLLRKVVSSAREGLEKNQSKSEFGTKSNVGFRPSLTFTSENEGGTFVPGKTPVDLFFLFDASASQDTETSEMLHSALQIVDMFSSDDPAKDICHVGSALFLGNNIRLMCSNQVETFNQTLWGSLSDSNYSYAQGNAPKNYVVKHYYTYSGLTEQPWNLVQDDAVNVDGTTGYRKVDEEQPIRPGCEDWVQINYSNDYSNISKLLKGTGADGNPTGLLLKFEDYKNNSWMCGTKSDSEDATLFELPPAEGVQMRKMISEVLEEQTEGQNEIPALRDTGGGGGGHSPPSPPSSSGGSSSGGGGSSPPIYLSSISHRNVYKSWSRKLAVHTGVPTWFEQLDASHKDEPNVVDRGDGTYVKIHFGDIDKGNIDKYDWYFVPEGKKAPDGWKNPFSNTFDFFTNELGGSGVSSYNWPFYWNTSDTTKVLHFSNDEETGTVDNVFAYKGVLSNLWRGCEPVCAITSKLLKNGFFCSYPWNHGIGYMFRKNTPKLIFVFANEYDNAYTTSYSYYGGFAFSTPVVVPGAQNGRIVFVTKSLTGTEQKEAIDPFCVKQLSGSTSSDAQTTFNGFMSSIGLNRNSSDKTQMINAIKNLISEDNLGSVSNLGYDNSSLSGANVQWTIGEKVKSNTGIICSGYSASRDLDGTSFPFNGMTVDQILTSKQMEMLCNEAKFPGISYSENIKDTGAAYCTFKSCLYSVPKTVGFYQLRNTMANITEPFNTYMFVSDANAPVPLYDVDISDKDENWWKDESNVDEVKKIANSLFLFNDSKLFDTIGDVEIKGEFGKALYKCVKGKDYTSGANFYKWKDLLTYNFGWHSLNNDSETQIRSSGMQQLAKNSDAGRNDAQSIWAVFQSLTNPYTNTNIVLATRSNYNSFTSAVARGKSTASYWNKFNAKNPATALTQDGETNVPITRNAKNDYSCGYLFMVGLEACQTGKSSDKKAYVDGSWRQEYANNSNNIRNANFRDALAKILLKEVFGKTAYTETTDEESGTTTITWNEKHCFTRIWNYMTLQNINKVGWQPVYRESGANWDTRGTYYMYDETEDKYAKVSSSNLNNYEMLYVSDIGWKKVSKGDDGWNTNRVYYRFDDSDSNNKKYVQVSEDELDNYTKLYISDDSERNWIDKHICPYYLWSSASRRKSGKFCRYTCTEESIEHLALAVKDVYLHEEVGEGETDETIYTDERYDHPDIDSDSYVMLLSSMFSSLSVKMNYDGITYQEPETAHNIYYYSYSRYYNNRLAFGTFPASNYTLTKEPTSYVTIEYNKGKNKKATGSLKIVVLDEAINTSDPRTAIFPDNGGFGEYGIYLNLQTDFRNVYHTITQTNTSEYPLLWKNALYKFSTWYYSENNLIAPAACKNVWDCTTEESRLVVKYVKEFYNNLKTAMPGLMSYRYQNEIFSEFTNSAKKSVVDYDDVENTIVAKAIPIMRISGLKDLFYNSFNGGNFETGKQFNYSHCIVDLNPTIDNYNSSDETRPEFILDCTQFPMSFTTGVNVNVAEYQTSKLVLERIDKISGEKFDTFTMGSHATDYDLITDSKKRKYKDDESIVDGAVDDYAQVTLGNGGSYQKKYVNNDLKGDEHPNDYEKEDDLYYANLKTSTPNDSRQIVKRNPESGVVVEPTVYDAKYFKNKHFFMDPFALTIAQWCYVKLNSQRTDKCDVPTPEKARELLRGEGHLAEIEKSYWRYVCVWGETGEWDHWKDIAKSLPDTRHFEDDIIEIRDTGGGGGGHNSSSISSSIVSGKIGVAPTEADEDVIQKLVSSALYNPLEDTRPYYYATYNLVRSTGQVYQSPKSGGSKYIIDNERGDEFQMVSGVPNTPVSFMDILNSKVVFQTQKRIYGAGDVMSVAEYEAKYDQGKSIEWLRTHTSSGVYAGDYDSMGESPLMPYLMNARDNKNDIQRGERSKQWCSGKEGGINFDLPTEAQWEYCCRDGSISAIPPAYDIGDKFEESYDPLDLIAWYKFKVIGSLPEPERFCAWRISKMLFGIGKDKEQINNVYETETT